MPKTPKLHTRAQPSVRIIGGKLRGRKLQFPDSEGLRPTLGRTRETLFNWLVSDIVDAHCLDLFAGSGALGLEALSRGAKSVVFVEQERRTSQSLRENIERFGLTGPQAQVITGDAIRFLDQLDDRTAPFDLIFLDPPFGSNLLQAALISIARGCHLNHEGLIYYECAASTQLQHLHLHQHQHLQSVRHSSAGDYRYGLLQLP